MKFFLPTGKPVKVITAGSMIYVDIYASEADVETGRAETRYSLENWNIMINHHGILVRGYDNLATGDFSYKLRRIFLCAEKP